MNSLKWIVLLVLAGLAALFFWQNQPLLSQEVAVGLRLPLLEIRFLPPDGPRLDLMLVVAFAAGFLLAYVLGLIQRMRGALRVRRLSKELATLQNGGTPAGRRRGRGAKRAPAAEPAPPAVPPAAPPAPPAEPGGDAEQTDPAASDRGGEGHDARP